MKKEEKKDVATSASISQIEGNALINKETVVLSNGILLIDNGEDATEKIKKKRKRPLPQETTSKREEKELERPNCSKYSFLATCVIIFSYILLLTLESMGGMVKHWV
jgi:hypothetical protein